MDIRENVNLKNYSTLGVGGPARYFAEVTTEEDLKEAIKFAQESKLLIFVLGGGSNILFSDQGFAGLVIRPLFKGITVQDSVLHSSEDVIVSVGAGEELDRVVEWSVSEGYWGLENLSFIPGLIGALAIQNVGAYGQEASELIESVTVIEISTGEKKIMSRGECDFTYRHSRFNTYDKNKYVILSLTLKLSKTPHPKKDYKDVAKYFADHPNVEPALSSMREAIIVIRKKKGQDWKVLPSVGSFFSNFRLTHQEFENLCEKIKKDFSVEKEHELRELVGKVGAPSDKSENKIKLPAAWIIDNLLNMKGYVHNERVRVSPYHALNLINTNNASSSDILELYHHLKKLVKEKTGLDLVNEPEFVGF